jgi:2-keto-3-deoxy-galactonokinase
MLYKFVAVVNGEEKIITGKGTSPFMAEIDATINVMRETHAKFDQIQVKKVISFESTGEWV